MLGLFLFRDYLRHSHIVGMICVFWCLILALVCLKEVRWTLMGLTYCYYADLFNSVMNFRVAIWANVTLKLEKGK